MYQQGMFWAPSPAARDAGPQGFQALSHPNYKHLAGQLCPRTADMNRAWMILIAVGDDHELILRRRTPSLFTTVLSANQAHQAR